MIAARILTRLGDVPISTALCIAANVFCGCTVDSPFAYGNWFAVGLLVSGEFYRPIVMNATDSVLATLREMQKIHEIYKGR